MDPGHENGSDNNASVEAELILNSDPCLSSILSEDSENEEQSRTDSSSSIEEVISDGIETSNSPHSVVSYSSKSDSTSVSDSQFSLKVSPKSNNNNPQSSTESIENAKVHKGDVNNDSNAAILSTKKVCETSDSISQVPDITPSSHFPTLLQTKPPPVQIMQKSECYDPNRIPASIFISGSSTAIDWSTASNDSLFSIPIENNLAREQSVGPESSNLHEFVITEESQKRKKLHKSGELSRPNEFPSCGLVKISNQVKTLGQTSPVKKGKKDKPKKLDLRNNRVFLTEKPNNIHHKKISIEDKAKLEGYKNKNTIQYFDENRTNNQSSSCPIDKNPSKKTCCLSSSSCSWACCIRKSCCCLCSSNCISNCCSGRTCWSCKWSCSPSFCFKCSSCSPCSKCSCSLCSPCSKCSCPSGSPCSKCSCPSCSPFSKCSCSSCSPFSKCSCSSCSPCYKCSCSSCSPCSKFSCSSCSPCSKCSCPSCSPCSKCSCSSSFCCKWPSLSTCFVKCRSPNCGFWKYTKGLCCCSSYEGSENWRRRKWCSCSCCCPCSSCSYSCR